MRTRCWLKLEPQFSYSHRQLGWKVVSVTQSQPKSGYAICLDLDIPAPEPHMVVLEESDVKVMTETDRIVEEVVDGLSGA